MDLLGSVNLGVQGEEVTEELNMSVVDYMTFIEMCPDFIGLDISLSSTGWVRWKDGVLTEGAFSLNDFKDDPVATRREFRRQIKEIFNGNSFEYVFIEDVIGSVNFETAKTLYQLNPLVDDMIDDGVVHANKVLRIGNTEWKKYLRLASGYKSKIRADSDDKRIIRDSLLLLGYGDGTNDTIVQDIYDALGLSVGISYKLFVLKEDKPKKKLKKDITKVYKIRQFDDEYEALDEANKVGGEIMHLDFTNIKRDLKYNFKKMIEDTDDDTKTYFITIPTNKIGSVALTKGFDLTYTMSYLVVFR